MRELWNHKPWFDILVHKVLNPSKAILVELCDHLPQPTKENLSWQNAKLLVELRDWFLAQDTNSRYKKIYMALWNLLIIKYETDTQYQVRFEETLKKAIQMSIDNRWEFPERSRHKEEHWRKE